MLHVKQLSSRDRRSSKMDTNPKYLFLDGFKSLLLQNVNLRGWILNWCFSVCFPFVNAASENGLICALFPGRIVFFLYRVIFSCIIHMCLYVLLIWIAPHNHSEMEQLIWIVPLDPNHVFVPINSCLKVCFSLCFHLRFQMPEHLYGCITCCFALVWAVWFNRRTAWKTQGANCGFSHYSSQWELFSGYSALLTYFIPAARSSLT